MKKYRLVDNAMGWLAFIVAAFVYCSTVEPTASFWDCPEFITTGYKMEIGHPPGAPFFMLTANLFSQFASDPSQVAYMVNIMNALLSAVCILFLFWTITHLARRLILRDWSELTTGKLIAIEAAGLVGALIYTFSDTFWYSAAEGEVYAYSSAFTAVVFWLILKWEDEADQPKTQVQPKVDDEIFVVKRNAMAETSEQKHNDAQGITDDTAVRAKRIECVEPNPLQQREGVRTGVGSRLDLMAMDRAERIKTINNLLRNDVNGAQIVEAMGLAELNNMGLDTGRQAAESNSYSVKDQTAGSSVAANGDVRQNASLYDLPD